MFLKEIEYFDYSHSEELGNAYEYLLSIMSSQGDAGQFRTPRHIIDFMVEVVAPTKDDTVLNPACGTAGFLISAYKHILRQHDGKDDPEHKEKPLTSEERKKLINNFEGYDIDPTMARVWRRLRPREWCSSAEQAASEAQFGKRPLMSSLIGRGVTF